MPILNRQSFLIRSPLLCLRILDHLLMALPIYAVLGRYDWPRNQQPLGLAWSQWRAEEDFKQEANSVGTKATIAGGLLWTAYKSCRAIGLENLVQCAANAGPLLDDTIAKSEATAGLELKQDFETTCARHHAETHCAELLNRAFHIAKNKHLDSPIHRLNKWVDGNSPREYCSLTRQMSAQAGAQCRQSLRNGLSSPPACYEEAWRLIPMKVCSVARSAKVADDDSLHAYSHCNALLLKPSWGQGTTLGTARAASGWRALQTEVFASKCVMAYGAKLPAAHW